MPLFHRKDSQSSAAVEGGSHGPTTTEKASIGQRLPIYNHNGHRITRGVKPDGESGRRGFHPLQFCRVIWVSNCAASRFLNLLWPFVPAGLALYYVRREATLWVFSINYIAMLPAANLLGFAGQELARKLRRVFGILLEVTFGSVVEIVLFMVLIVREHRHPGHYIPVIKAAILGSILTNLLLCLGLCFFLGGLRRYEQEFHGAISEVSAGVLLVAGFALLIPSAFYSALQPVAYGPGDRVPKDKDGYPEPVFTKAKLLHDTLAISRGTAIILMIAFVL